MEAAEKKPAPAKPAGPTDREKNRIVLSALIKAGADMIESWDDPRVSKSEARAFAAHRLSYCPLSASGTAGSASARSLRAAASSSPSSESAAPAGCALLRSEPGASG